MNKGTYLFALLLACFFMAIQLVQGTAYYVSTNGSDSYNGLSTGTPWRTVGYAVNRVDAGDIVYIRGGEYREFVDCTNTRGRIESWITVRAYSNEIPIIKGSDIVTGWEQHSATIWKKTNWTIQAQQVFVDGRLLQQIGWPNDYVSTNVFSCNMAYYIYFPYGHDCEDIDTTRNTIKINGISELVPYSFFYDKNSKTLYLRLNTDDDPNSHRVEVSVRCGIFYMSEETRYLYITGLHFRHNNSFTFSLHGYPGVLLGNFCILANCDVQWCDASAVSFRHNAKLLDSYVSNNGMDGARVSSATDIMISGCTFTYNNYRRVTGNYLAAIKCHPASSGTVEDNEIAWNSSMGIWFDTCQTGEPLVVRRNVIHHNRQRVPAKGIMEWSCPGVFIEYSENADVHDNLIYSNAISGIELSGSSNCRFYNNTIAGTYRPQGHPAWAYTYAMLMYVHSKSATNANNRVFNNILVYNNTEFDHYSSPNNGKNIYGNLVDHNCYFRHKNSYTASPACSLPPGINYSDASFCNAQTFPDAYQAQLISTNISLWIAATGWDSNSIALDPLLEAYHLATNSPCVNQGTVSAFMNLTKDLDGRSRIEGARIDMGAFELGDFLCDFQQNAWTGFYPLAVTFSGVGIGTNSEVAWYGWDFDNDGALDHEGTEAVVTNVYQQAGTYSVGLYVSNTLAQTASCIKSNNVYAMVQYPPECFTLSAFALTNNVALRWPRPVLSGISNSLVCIRYSTNDFPSSLSDGLPLVMTTHNFYMHTNLITGIMYYYTIWVSDDGESFYDP